MERKGSPDPFSGTGRQVPKLTIHKGTLGVNNKSLFLKNITGFPLSFLKTEFQIE